VPPFRLMPIMDLNYSQALLSLVFPSLYPYSMADFVYPREQTIDYTIYIQHAIK
ncbi:hypothetical protein SODALDRAFT_284994, partial [Sodiomyces alkalinus F11]